MNPAVTVHPSRKVRFEVAESAFSEQVNIARTF